MTTPGDPEAGGGEGARGERPAPAAPNGASRATWTVQRIVLSVVTAVMAVPFLMGLWLVAGSVTGAGDPHGYALLGGTFLALVAGIVLVCVVPWLFAPPVRLRAFGLAILAYVVLVVLVGIALANV